jgi:hypothetical protein
VIRSRTVSLALVGLFVWVTGCSSHTQIELGEVADHGKVRVTLIDGERETIHDPWVEGDSIRSTDADAIPLGQVAEFEAVGTDEVGTVFTVLGVSVLALVAFVGIGCAIESCSMNMSW